MTENFNSKRELIDATAMERYRAEQEKLKELEIQKEVKLKEMIERTKRREQNEISVLSKQEQVTQDYQDRQLRE